MSRIADAVIVLWGWRRYLLALVAGAATVLALPPFNLFPVAWLTLPFLIWLIDGSATPEGTFFLRRLWPAAAAGWWFGFGYFLAGLWWVGSSFLVDAETFGWIMPFAVVALPAGLALFWGFGAALARAFWTDGWPRILVLAVAMTAAEWLRGNLFTGFPWNAFGYTLMPGPLLMQSASLVGIWGVTLLAFLVFGAPAALAGAVGESRRTRYAAFILLLALLAADAVFGLVRLRGAEVTFVPDVRLRIVQANIPQAVKADRNAYEANFRKHLELSDGSTSPERTGAGSATHIIWPETAVPYFLTFEPGALTAIANLLPPGTTLITGAPRAEPREPGQPFTEVFNSIYVIDDQGGILDAYDKMHLVPFGEYVPLREWVEWLGLRQVVPIPIGFAMGTTRPTLAAHPAPPFAPLICYEIIFPEEIIGSGERPGWILNVTNDDWFGDTPGPRQHLQQAIVRAVEQGLPLVRSANSGISAIVDPYGRVLHSLDLGLAGIIDGDLPAALTPTFYGRYGDVIPAILLLIVAIVAGFGGFTMGRGRR